MKYFLLIAHAAVLRGAQPFRCATSVCKAFDSSCGGNSECVTDKCYEGKCGMGATCAPAQHVCFTDSPHTCCTGACQGVLVRADCLKLLGLEGGVINHEGVNVDRQCDRVGVCEHWPGQEPPGPSVLTTPWSVDPTDNVAKYYALAGLTFKAGTQVDVSRVVARRMGRLQWDVDPSVDKPRGVADAGILQFVGGSRVAREISAFFEFGDEKFCIAPILNNGQGGGYYAVGIDCCTEKEFSCGDADGTAGVVVNSDLPNFGQARINLESEKGNMYHGDGRGIDSDAPIFVYWSANAEGERNNPTGQLTYVLEAANSTFCVAPIGVGVEPVAFFAVGQNCCDDTSFTCGPVDNVDALSGSLVHDLTGDYIFAVKQGEFSVGYTAVPKPIFLSWTRETLVTKP